MTTCIIRPLVPADGPDAGDIFFDAVHRGTVAEYDQDQRNAWAGAVHDPSRWVNRLEGVDGFAAELDGRMAGFMTVDDAGHVDLAFIRPDVIGQGLGRKLHAAVETWARDRHLPRMTTHASLKARPFFQHMGWRVVKQQTIERGGVTLTNFVMDKVLDGQG